MTISLPRRPLTGDYGHRGRAGGELVSTLPG